MRPALRGEGAHVLVVDDDEDILRLLTMRLKARGFRVSAVGSAEQALVQIAVDTPRVVVSDVRLPGQDGLALFEEIRRTRPTLPVILLTAHGNIPDAVDATSRGVFGYLTKPFDSQILLEKIDRALQLSEPTLPAGEEGTAVGEGGDAWMEGVIFRSSRMAALMADARMVAASDASVLIRGESGSGKEVLARAIHRASPRAKGPFVAINCGAIPEQLLESELFGHAKGAFTGAATSRVGLFQTANGGTLFLDEIGDMPLLMQTRLLRVLEERAVVPVGAVEAQPVDLRLISASHRDLGELVAAGQFREDLYYRLNGLKLHLPALRERQDRAALLDQLLSEEARGVAVALAPAARQALLDYAWPGNVRQMRTVLRTLLALCEDDWIDLEDLPDEVRGAPQALASVERGDDPLARAERDTLLRLLEAQCWHVSRVAAELGISRNTLYRKLQRHGIRRTRLSPAGVDEAVDKLSAAGASPDHP